MALLARHEPVDLERELVRKSVLAMAAGVVRCHDCGRSPLVGEQAHAYDRGRVVCELCRPLRREAPQRSDIVRSGDHKLCVRISAREAA